MTPEEFMKEYEHRANSKDIESILPLIDERAVYWFSEGSYKGIDQIKEAFERTWSTIKEERYTIDNLNWIANCQHTAVCIYDFHSKGNILGCPVEFNGRGTNVIRQINGQWKITHEHLSRER